MPGSERFPTVDMTVEVVEPLGFETILDLATGHRNLTARVSPRVEPREGDRIQVMLDTDHMHLFDPDSGERLAG